MDVSSFTRLFPQIYHLTFTRNLDSIRQHGLRSTRDLADLYAFSPEERAAVFARRRCIQSLHGIEIRDQIPMHESKMKSCLVRISIPEWLDLLNSKIFFLLTEEKARAFAARYADYDNTLLQVDTAALLATHAAETTLCRINSGAFLQNPRPRGRDSFIPLAAYDYKKKRDTPAELTVHSPIPNLLDIATILPLEPPSTGRYTQS
jgi:hypothetical protein